MMKRAHLVILLAVCLCMLTGCSSDAKKYAKNTLVVKSNGSLEEIAVEDFTDSSVQAEELEDYIDEQIADYDGDEGKLVKKSYINTEDMSKVKLVLTYKDMEAFNGFNLLECQLDDYENMEADDLNCTYTSAEGKSVKYGDLTGTDKAKVLVLSEATDVVVKGDILYYNKEVTVKDGVATTTGEDNAIIIYR
jgi:hypothetical protein